MSVGVESRAESRPVAAGCIAAATVTLLLTGCGVSPSGTRAGPPTGAAPVQYEAAASAPDTAPVLEQADGLSGSGPYPVDLQDIVPAIYDPNTAQRTTQDVPPGRIESPVPEAEMARQRRAALALPASAAVQSLGRAGPVALGPTLGTSFDSLDFTECCGGGGSTPPDPELAVGPGHIIAVVNVAFEIYDKTGLSLAGPTTFSSFFSGTPGCSGNLFDPNVLYDEAEDRFFLAADIGGTGYCAAVTSGSDPTLTWNTYRFPTNTGGGGVFFDYPHAGVGREAIYVGSNQFLGGFLEGRVFALDKHAMYAGDPSPGLRTHSTGFDSTPQPANLHGFAQGTWPADGPHYLMTEVFDGATHSVWSWTDPFGADAFGKLGDLDLDSASGVISAQTVDAPQQAGGSIQANDFRGLDTEYRNGRLWMTNMIGCNPGAGTVDCVRWAEIDPVTPAVVQAGVFSSNGDYRIFPDLAANHCNDMAVGYTKTNSSMHPGAYAAGRNGADSLGTLQAETLLKPGEAAYLSFDGVPRRWGDYTGMTADPDGLTFWYLGQYSKLTGASTRWGNYVGSFTLGGCPIVNAAPAPIDFGAVEVGASPAVVEVTLSNTGSGAGSITGMTLSDPVNFLIDVNGGADPCFSSMPTIPAGDSCTVELLFNPAGIGFFDETLSVESANPANDRTVQLAGAGYVPCPFSTTETVTNVLPENGMDIVSACLTILVGPYELGASGNLSLTAGHSIELHDGVIFDGTLSTELDPFLALP